MVYETLKAIPRSFADLSLSREVIYQWRGYGIKVAMILAMAITLINVAQIYIGINRIDDHHIKDFAKQFPTVHVKDGEAHVANDIQMPYDIPIASDQASIKEALLRLDTRDPSQINESQDNIERPQNAIILKRNHIEVILDHQIQNRLALSQYDDFTIDSETILNAWGNIKQIYMLAPFLFLGFLLVVFIQILPIILIGYLTTAFLSEEYTLDQRFRLAFISFAPAIILSLLTLLFLSYHMNYITLLAITSLYQVTHLRYLSRENL